MKQFKIRTYHLKSKENAKGESPLYFRLSLESGKVQISTGIFLKAEFWDRKKQQLKSNHQVEIILNEIT